MSGLQMWLEIDWSAPEPGLLALEAYVRSVRAGDAVELAVAAGPLTEEEAGARLMAALRDRRELAGRIETLPDIVVYAGDVPDGVEDHLRLPGPGEQALQVLRESFAPYVAVTPVLNQAEWARTWKPEPGFRHLMVDNASDDGTAEILRERGADVVVNERRLTRVENWAQSIKVFLATSDATWLKWVFAGDRLLPGAAGILDRATEAYPEAMLIAAVYDWKLPDGNMVPVRSLTETKLVQPAESLQRFVLQGNWLGGPIALALHRDVLADVNFGLQPWVADWQASMEIARRHPILYVDEKIGFFDSSRGRYHRAHEADVYTMVQDIGMRYLALQHLHELMPHLDLSKFETTLDSAGLTSIARRIQTKQQAAAAPPATRVGFEATTRGGAARVRLGGGAPKKKRPRVKK
jgi:hypothetical protein